jgi:hypothetical protein
VWGAARDDVWAAGSTGSPSQAQLLHWNGTVGERRTVNVEQRLFALWGPGAADVWAAGDAGAVLRRVP